MAFLVSLLCGSAALVESIAQVRVPVIKADAEVEGLSEAEASFLEVLGDLDGDGSIELGIDGGFYIRVWQLKSRTDIIQRDPSIGSSLNGTLDLTSLAVLPDLDGDGTAEVAVGVSEKVDDRGAVWIRSSAREFEIATDRRMLRPTDLTAKAHFGDAVCSIPSLDADSLTDLVVGAPGMDAIYVLYPDAVLEAKGYKRLRFSGLEVVGQHFGAAVAHIGDLDQNGVPDIAVGAPGAPNGGAIYIGFLAQQDSLVVMRWTVINEEIPLDAGDGFGAAVSLGPDLDRDGVHDLLVGAPYDDDGGSDRGAVWILLLRRDGSIKGYHKLSHSTNGVTGLLADNARFGESLEWLGDVDDDGFDDIAVGAPGEKSVWFLYGLPAYPISSLLNIHHEPREPTVGQSVSINGYWGNSVRDAVLQFKDAGGAKVFEQSMVLNATTSETSGEIPSRFVGPAGTEYAILVTFIDGTTMRFPEAGFYSFPVRVPAGLSATIAGGSDVSSYRLVTIPLQLDKPDSRGIVESALGPPDPYAWRFFGQDETGGQIRELGESEFQFRPAKAFWIASSRDVVLQSGPGTTLPAWPPIRIRVNPGWNLVGSPLAIHVPIERLRLDSNDPIDLRAFSGSWTRVDTLKPMEGYALWSSAEDTLEFRLAGESNQDESVSVAIRPEWQVDVTACDGSGCDTGNLIVITEGARTGRDGFDRPEPPFMGNDVRLFFEGADWGGLADGSEVDARPPGFEGYVWTLKLRASSRDVVTLNFSKVETVPEPLDVTLVDQEGHRLADLRTSPNVSIEARPGEVTKLQIVVGSEEFVASNEQVVERSLSVYPNPFSDRLSIRYSANAHAPVYPKIYDVLGRLVRDMKPAALAHSGEHSLQWDGTLDSGARVAPGIYIIRLETPAGGESASALYVR